MFGVEFSSDDYDPRKPFMMDDSEALRAVMRQLAAMIRYELDDNVKRGALTLRVGKESIVNPACPNGYRSIVKLSRNLYDSFATAL